MNNTLHLEVSDQEIEEVFAPGIARIVSDRDPEWTAKEQQLKIKMAKGVPWWRRLLRPVAEKRVRDAYEKKWTPEAALARFTRRADNRSPIVWGDRRYFAYGIWIKRVHLLFLMRLIEKLQPTNVLEVGSGMGLNLCILAARFPNIKFTGIELTAAGDEVARAFRAMPKLPEQFSQFSPLPLVDEEAHQRIELNQGSAAQLPFKKGSFDLVYSIQALEQMESIRDQVLKQIANVCSGHVAMFEPFAEWNKNPLRRALISSRGYFAAGFADLRRYGFEPVFTSGDMPTKFAYGVGLVIARRLPGE
ncbi:MAG TPA: class I SAM-dependent methyltransferase [Xanthobacteraceae bacterium]|nr:class I SAM-dependent methyltransferase [Xanthobacteraceae bacterium]